MMIAVKSNASDRNCAIERKFVMNQSPAPELTTCQCCHQPLRWYKQMSHFYGECTDRTCRRFAITRELNELATISEELVDSFLRATRRSNEMTVDLSAYL
jgi:hypothetical protein